MCDNFVIRVVPLNPLYIYPVGHGYNQVHDGVVLQLEDEELESIMHDMFNSKYFISQEEDVTTVNNQGSFLTTVRQFLIHQEYDISNLNKPPELIVFYLIHLMMVVQIYMLIFLRHQNSMIHHHKVHTLIRALRHFSSY